MWQVVSFPILEELQLWKLNPIEMIWPDKLQEVSHMQNLKDLTVSDCDKLKYLFSSAVARSFIQLKNLNVRWCENMEEIVVIKEGGEEEDSSNDTISFPKLQHIQLCGLRNLKRFSSRKPLAVECEGLEPFFNENVSFPMLESLDLSSLDSVEMILAGEIQEVSYMHNLKVLTVDSCSMLKYVEGGSVMEELHHTLTEKVVVPNLEEMSLKRMFMPSSMSFQNLRQIRIIKYDGMINLMNSSTTRSLVQLQEIIIWDCKEMRQVIVDEEEASENVMVFPKLEALMLCHLPNLKSFNSGNSEIRFSNLEKVFVIECPHMENFSSGNVITSKLGKIITKLLRDEYYYNVMYAEGIEEVWKGDLKTSVRIIWEEAKETKETREIDREHGM